MQILKFLEGNKTYLVAVSIFIIGGLEALGYTDVAGSLYALLGALGLGTLRHGVSKAE